MIFKIVVVIYEKRIVMSQYLTEDEKKIYDELRAGFNINKETTEYDFLPPRRVEISRVWAKKLLIASFYLNVAAVVLTIMAALTLLAKPAPDYYASTPSGKIYKLDKVEVVQ